MKAVFFARASKWVGVSVKTLAIDLMTAPRLIALRKSGGGYRWRSPDGRANPHVLSCADCHLAATNY